MAARILSFWRKLHITWLFELILLFLKIESSQQCAIKGTSETMTSHLKSMSLRFKIYVSVTVETNTNNRAKALEGLDDDRC